MPISTPLSAQHRLHPVDRRGRPQVARRLAQGVGRGRPRAPARRCRPAPSSAAWAVTVTARFGRLGFARPAHRCPTAVTRPAGDVAQHGLDPLSRAMRYVVGRLRRRGVDGRVLPRRASNPCGPRASASKRSGCVERKPACPAARPASAGGWPGTVLRCRPVPARPVQLGRRSVGGPACGCAGGPSARPTSCGVGAGQREHDRGGGGVWLHVARTGR